LVDLRPDAIFARGTIETVALARETRTIPIVFAAVSDPIGSGFAKSLSRPGSNMTGFTNIESTLGGKWVALLKEIAPATMHVGLLFNPTTVAPLQFYLPSIQTAALSYVVNVETTPVHAKDEIEGAIAALARRPGASLIAMPDNFTGSNLGLIGSLAARYRVPAIHYLPSYAETGGLISYGVDFTGLFRQAAGYIDRVLKGASPADLPIQLPTKLELLINLKVAKTLNLTVPPSMLVAADRLID
jgi:putative ABC transport system substrate-binding protein